MMRSMIAIVTAMESASVAMFGAHSSRALVVNQAAIAARATTTSMTAAHIVGLSFGDLTRRV
jgi:hypothetical protein